jgi:signal-transduction protein with cAMP-binding, CBS, and nucleotidyltransferase domain
VKQLNTTGMNRTQQAAMQAMLGPLLEQMFGSAVPTLRNILASSEQFASVSSSSTVREAATLMAETRKAVLVLEDDALVGILTPKDVMHRVLAHRLDPDVTSVQSVMTPNPDFVSPDATLLDALHQMHDHKYLHLPVVEDDGAVLGLVDVIEIMCSAGGSGGWRAFFGNSMGDDDSDTSSLKSGRSARRSTMKPQRTVPNSTSKDTSQTSTDRPVSKLHPKMPTVLAEDVSVQEVAETMCHDRVDAALIVSARGALNGIITDNDLARRVVAKFLDPLATAVAKVMTRSPTCVTMEDSALDALQTMLENKFRHLPVLDKDGAVVGVLDIAKCLYDAISRIERAQEKAGGDSGSTNIAEAMHNLGAKGLNRIQQQAMQAMLGPLMEQMFGSAVPTLRTVMSHAPEYESVSPTTNVREAAVQMAQSRKAILVVSENELVGIFTPKDLMNRVLARRLNPDVTAVEGVMTPNPDFVHPDMTLLDALHQMHDHKYLHLPVVEEDGTIVGLVDVIEIMCSAGGSAGWRAFFGSAMGDDDISDTASLRSSRDHVGTSRREPSVRGSVKPQSAPSQSGPERPVSRLRPKKPVTCKDTDNVQIVAELMANDRSDAALLVDRQGALTGIVTDNDLTRRLVAKFLNPAETSISKVMTKGPRCVAMDDSALDALQMMLENRFRHLPVLDGSGVVVGVLDIAKCLYDAISRIEKVREKGEAGGGAGGVGEALKSMDTRGMTKQQQIAMQALLGPIMQQMFGSSDPTLRGVLEKGGEIVSITPTTNVREAAAQMAQARKAALVLDGNDLIGIITPKDILNRVIARSLNPDLTAVDSVMTPSPDTVSPDMTVLDALHQMHDHKYLHLPVVEEDGTVVGLVDVIDIMCGAGGSAGWRSFFSNTMTMKDDGSETGSIRSKRSSSRAQPRLSKIITGSNSSPSLGTGSRRGSVVHAPKATRVVAAIEEDEEGSDAFSISSEPHVSIPGKHRTASVDSSYLDSSGPLYQREDFVFKVADARGHMHRFTAPVDQVSVVRAVVAEKIRCAVDDLVLQYLDAENENVVIDNDAALQEAVLSAQRAGNAFLKLQANPLTAAEKRSSAESASGGAGNTPLFIAGAGVVVVAAVATAMMFFIGRKQR